MGIIIIISVPQFRTTFDTIALRSANHIIDKIIFIIYFICIYKYTYTYIHMFNLKLKRT